MANGKRRRNFVDKQVQGALILQTFRHWISFFVGTFSILCCLQLMLTDPQKSLQAIIGDTWYRYVPVFLPLLVLTPAFVNDSIKLSNRFAGPMLRLRRELKKLAQGQPARPIKLRKGDFWHDVAEDFNLVLARLEQAGAANRLAQETDSEAADQPEQQHEAVLCSS
jgi:nitrogen fixation/metabolism regulation signal transduction histidine kinase